MKLTKLTVALVACGALFLGGCATQYDKYLAQIDSINKAQTQEVQVRDAARQMDSQRIAELAASGSDATKIAASMAIMTQNIVADLASKGGSSGSKAIVPAAPPDPMQGFWNMLGVVVPSAVQVYGINRNAAVAITQSNNSRDVAVSTNSTFATMATSGFTALGAAQPNVTTTTTITSGGDTVNNGNNNQLSRRNCTGGTATSTGNGGAAASGGSGGTGATDGGAGAASGAAGQGNPSATAGAASC